MKTAQMHLVVATLLMTVTFTAGLTLPGGFESDTNSPNKGMAILLRRTAFRAFAVSNAIAFACSSGAVFAYFAMAANAISAVTKLTVIIQIYNMAIALQISAMAAVVVAFATVCLAVTVCVIDGISFYMVCFMILLPKKRPRDNLNRSIV
ncbi:hypothetical protein H5410_037139 [Solanum commersonii]|uniref:PGG domain-containing protein n=1 Tax=Solanum commersonii TaxID=4109 RepID=A0A9J5Y5G1_SOLCO|nr:hypothetical protein H5410_037139 [Solanum commersonii]